MATTVKYLTLNNLATFKTAQDQSNLKKYASLDTDSKVLQSQIPKVNEAKHSDQASQDDEGNKITETYAKLADVNKNFQDLQSDVSALYATKNELAETAQHKATTSNLGVIQVGSNLSVDSNGILSVNKKNVTDALGFTPIDAASIEVVTTAEINALFK